MTRGMKKATRKSRLLLLFASFVFAVLVSSPSTISLAQAQAIDESLPSQPTYNLRPLDYSTSYRQNVCERQAAFHNGNVTLRNALEGLQLRPFFLTGIQRFSPTNDDGSVPLDSKEPAIRVLDELAERARFTWRESYGVGNLADAMDDSVETSPNTFKVNLDDILHWAVRTYDLAANEFSKTLTRVANGTSFLEGHVDASIIMVGKSEEEEARVDLFSFLAPFDWQVWLLSLLTMVVAGLVYQWMEWLNEDSDRQELQNKPTETVYFAALSFNGDIKFQPSTNYARIFVLTLAFWGLIMSSAYTANLASFLVLQNTPVLQIETVGEAVAANLPMCVVQGSAQESEVHSTYPLAKLVPVPTGNPNRMFTDVLKGRCKLAITPIFLWDQAKRDRDVNVGCKLQWIGRTFRFVRSGFSSRSDSGTLCTNLIRDVLSVHITEMIDDGTLETIYRQFYRSIQTIDCNRGEDVIIVDDEESTDNQRQLQQVSAAEAIDSGEEEVQSLSLKDLGGLFIVIYAVGFLSCIAALITWYRKRQVQRRKTARATILQNELKLNVEVEEDRNGDLEQVTSENGNGHNFSEPEVFEREQLISKLDAMRRELEDMKSLIQRKDQ